MRVISTSSHTHRKELKLITSMYVKVQIAVTHNSVKATYVKLLMISIKGEEYVSQQIVMMEEMFFKVEVVK